MKIAIFHNFMDNIGGAEIVTLTMAQELGADIYTTNIDHDMIAKMGYENVSIHSIGKVPVNAPFRQQIVLDRFRKLKLTGKYDCFIICGDWAMSGGKHNKPNIWYVHSPIREIWDMYPYVRKHLVSSLKRPIFDVWVLFNQVLNRHYVKHIDAFICNSKNTQARLKKYLQKESIVVYPPIETKKYTNKPNEGYWLSVNRLLAQKRIGMQVEAFTNMPEEKLIIVGSYEQSLHFLEHAKYLNSIKPSNVEIKSWVSNEEMQELYAHAKGFIATARDEDFGMTPVEAMASGKPVIATYDGGYKESVLEGVTGMFLKEATPEALADVVFEIGKNPERFSKACIEHAQKFDTAVFMTHMRKAIQEVTTKHNV